ncbi:MAG: hypothetical protein ACE5KV_07130 [Thermoplasmata archaeon]
MENETKKAIEDFVRKRRRSLKDMERTIDVHLQRLLEERAKE